jgi:CPA1 family monovalent cation:H+ antiporter
VLLATVSVVLSTLVVGALAYFVLNLVGLHITLFETLLFGALISPTDPIAVIGIMKTARAPKSLEIQIAGESLFNDGIGVVVFMILLQLTSNGQPPSSLDVIALFIEGSWWPPVWFRHRLCRLPDAQTN